MTCREGNAWRLKFSRSSRILNNPCSPWYNCEAFGNLKGQIILSRNFEEVFSTILDSLDHHIGVIWGSSQSKTWKKCKAIRILIFSKRLSRKEIRRNNVLLYLLFSWSFNLREEERKNMSGMQYEIYFFTSAIMDLLPIIPWLYDYVLWQCHNTNFLMECQKHFTSLWFPKNSSAFITS